MNEAAKGQTGKSIMIRKIASVLCAFTTMAVAAPRVTVPTGIQSNVWQPGQPIHLEAQLKEITAGAAAKVTVIDYFGKEILNKDLANDGKTLSVDLEPSPDARNGLAGEQRISAEFKEVVLDSNRLEVQYFAEDGNEFAFGFCAGGQVRVGLKHRGILALT